MPTANPAIYDPNGPSGTPLALFESGAILLYLADKTGQFISANPNTRYETIQYVRECGLLPLRVAKAALAGMVITPFRAVFIEVENSAELREFRERLRDIVGAPTLIPPHISVLYTLDQNSQAPRPDFDAERLKTIAARCAEAIDDAHFTLGRPVVNSAGGGEADVRSWNVIRSL
jgi:glutathione S-transferase